MEMVLTNSPVKHAIINGFTEIVVIIELRDRQDSYHDYRLPVSPRDWQGDTLPATISYAGDYSNYLIISGAIKGAEGNGKKS